MSRSVTILAGLALLTVAAACNRQSEEVVYSEPAPAPVISPEPTYSKY
jgi:hypothetical protein